MKKKGIDRINLHKVLESGSFEHAVLCTFTFDPVFFEEYCLEKLKSVANTPNITVITDQTTYSDVLDEVGAHRPKQANIRYLLHPVQVPGVFHPKLYLFTHKNKGKLIVGSANFTRPGLTGNAEMVGVFDYETEENERFLPLFQSAYRYLFDVAADSHSPALISNVSAIGRESSWLTAPDVSEHPSIRFLHNLRQPLWDQVLAAIEPPIDRLCILSLFFDSEPRLMDTVAATLKPKEIRIFTENGQTTLSRSWFDHPLLQSNNTEVVFVSYNDEDRYQPLHAKAVYFEKDGTGTLLFGSANFTTPALLRTATQGNAEVAILISGLNSSDTPAGRLFDPCESAVLMQDPSSLHTRPKDTNEPNGRKTHIILVREAEVVDDRIQLTIDIPDDLDWNSLRADLTFADESTATITLKEWKGGLYVAELNPRQMSSLDRGSSTLCVSAFSGGQISASSNHVLIINLREFHTGKDLRRSRHLREAQENVYQFFQILSELLDDSDENKLLMFFNMCDIPILEASRPALFRTARPRWDGGDSMRSLGKKNLKIYEDLHQAALGFFDRHFRKLHRHVETGSTNGVSNYLHIFFAMGGVLRSQIERLVQGLEAQDDPIKPQSWANARKSIDQYYSRIHDLFLSLDGEYLPKISRDPRWEKAQQQFREELENIDDLRFDLLLVKDRVDELCKNNLRILVPPLQKIAPQYFSCVFGEETWDRYVVEIEDLASTEKQLIA